MHTVPAPSFRFVGCSRSVPVDILGWTIITVTHEAIAVGPRVCCKDGTVVPQMQFEYEAMSATVRPEIEMHCVFLNRMCIILFC